MISVCIRFRNQKDTEVSNIYIDAFIENKLNRDVEAGCSAPPQYILVVLTAVICSLK